MNICLLMSRVGNGGLERVQINLANEFNRAGYKVEVVAGTTRESPYLVLDAGISTIEIAPRGPWQFTLGLATYMLRSKPDCILTTSNDIACIALLLRPFLASKTRIIVTQHLSLAAPLDRTSGASRMKHRLIFLAMRLLYPLADSIIAVSAGVASDMVKALSIPRESITVIYNPIVNADFQNKISETISWPWPADEIPTIIYVGRLSIEKRLDILLSATLPLLKSRQARLLFVGSGPLANWLNEQIETRELSASCVCTGFVHNVLPYIARSDVLVLPSDYEGFGNVLVEAMACGIQVISTNCPHGPSEILAEGDFGQLVPVADPIFMRQAILDAVLGRFQVPSEILKKRAADFSTEKAAASYMRAIESVQEPRRVH